MTRYKLTQTYTGSPDKGTVVYSGHRVEAYKDYKYKMKNTKGVSNHIFYDAAYIESFPRHWKQL